MTSVRPVSLKSSFIQAQSFSGGRLIGNEKINVSAPQARKDNFSLALADRHCDDCFYFADLLQTDSHDSIVQFQLTKLTIDIQMPASQVADSALLFQFTAFRF